MRTVTFPGTSGFKRSMFIRRLKRDMGEICASDGHVRILMFLLFQSGWGLGGGEAVPHSDTNRERNRNKSRRVFLGKH